MGIIPAGGQKRLRKTRLPIRTRLFGEAAKLPRKRARAHPLSSCGKSNWNMKRGGLRIQHIKRAARGIAAVCQHKLVFPCACWISALA